MSFALSMEIAGATCSIIYSILLMREKIAGWAFGIASSIFSMIVFYETRLYAQALISIYYAVIGVYGWAYWMKAKNRNEHIHVWNYRLQLLTISAGILLSCGGYFVLKSYTVASSPLLDSFLTVFGFLASIKEARKILSSWIYWLIINLFSGWLYFTQGLNYYAILMLVYAAICIPGYLSWLRIYRNNQHPLVDQTQ